MSSNPNSKQYIEVQPRLGGFLLTYILLSIPGFFIGLIWLLISFLILIGAFAGLAGTSNNNDSAENSLKLTELANSGSSEEGILVYDLNGPISSGGGTLSSASASEGIYTDIVNREFQEIIKNENIKNIVFKMNTGGGEAFASKVLGDLITDLTESKGQSQSVFYFDRITASGGVYAAYKNPNNYVFGSPYGQTGSIGVILSLPNFSGTAEKIGYSETIIKSSDTKDIGNIFRKSTQEEIAYFQNIVDTEYKSFKETVQSGRKLSQSQVEEIATGLVFLNEEAKEFGLIDEIGSLENSVKRAAENAKLSENYKIWEIDRRLDPFEDLFGLSTFVQSLNQNPIQQKLNEIRPGTAYYLDQFYN